MPVNKKNKKITEKGSVHPGAVPDTNMAEAAMSKTVDDLIQAVDRPLLKKEWCALVSAPRSPSDLTQLMMQAAERVISDLEDMEPLLEKAEECIKQACLMSQVRNPEVLAEFAIETSYDNLIRTQVRAILNDTWVRIWKGLSTGIDCYPGYPRHGLPISRLDDFALCDDTDDYANESLPADNTIEPFPGLDLPHSWSVDPLRPPIQAIRTAAELIKREVGDRRFNILGLELGYAVAAQALVTFLPKTAVITDSMVFDNRIYWRRSSYDYAAVVLNIPAAAAVEFVRFVLDPKQRLTRLLNDRFCRWPKTEQAKGLNELVQRAINKVRPGGILVIIADIESGSYSVANSMVENTGTFTPVSVAGNTGPVVFRYAEPPNSPYGVIPPTNRMVSAWRRAT